MNMMKSLPNTRSLDNHISNNPSQFCAVSAQHHRIDHGCEYPSAAYTVDIPGRPEHTLLKFQIGKPQDKGYNGILDSSLVAVLIDRQEFFMKNGTGSEENGQALECLYQALEWLKRVESNYGYDPTPGFCGEK